MLQLTQFSEHYYGQGENQSITKELINKINAMFWVNSKSCELPDFSKHGHATDCDESHTLSETFSLHIRVKQVFASIDISKQNVFKNNTHRVIEKLENKKELRS